MDQGSVGYSSHWFLIYVMCLNIVCFPDTSHRVWNDCKLAIGECSELYDCLACTLLMMNLHMGPFDSYAWWSETCTAAWAYFRSSNIMDPLRKSLLPSILRDVGEEDEVIDAAREEELWHGLPTSEAFSKKDVSVGFTRWFGWQHSWPSLDRRWHSWLVVLIWYGLRLGSLKQGITNALNLVARPQEVGEDGEPLKSGTGKKGNSKIGQLRTACRNKLHICTILLLDDSLQRRGRILWQLLRALELWHGQQNRENRDPQSNQAFWVAQTRGDGFKPLHDTIRTLSHPKALEYMGFQLALTHTQKKLSEDSPPVQAENHFDVIAVSFVVRLLKFRSRNLIWAVLGVPGMFVALLEEATAVSCLQKMKKLQEAWKLAREEGNCSLDEDPETLHI